MISVIVPIYNISSYLPKCLDSIVGQTYRELEILLVDDGSTDESSAICDDYAARDARIRVIHKENEGLVAARKTGLREAAGEYVGYVDGDDWIEPGMYEHMLSRMQQTGAEVVICGIYEDTGEICRQRQQFFPDGFYDKEKLIQQIYPQMIVGEEFFEWKLSPSVWDKLFKREKLLPFQEAVDERIRMGEDAACVYPLMLSAESCYFMEEPLYHYRQTAGSMVKQIQNYDKEREQFRFLYRTVLEQLWGGRRIYDLTDQWRKYVLFLMIPRSDGLYRGYQELDYLFPFPKVTRGKKVVLYGAGTYGQRLYRYLQRTGFCEITALIDRNAEELSRMGIPAKRPEILPELEYDVIAVTNTYWKSRRSVYHALREMGIAEEKICMIDEQLIFSKETAHAYDLI